MKNHKKKEMSSVFGWTIKNKHEFFLLQSEKCRTENFKENFKWLNFVMKIFLFNKLNVNGFGWLNDLLGVCGCVFWLFCHMLVLGIDTNARKFHKVHSLYFKEE